MQHPYEFSLQLRWGDMDPLNHVNNVRYLEYAQESRIAFIEELMAEVGRRPFVVARQEVDYLRPLVYRNRPVVVEVVVGTIGTRSYTLLQTIKELGLDGAVYAKVSTTMVGFDPDQQGSRPLHEDERRVLGAVSTLGVAL